MVTPRKQVTMDAMGMSRVQAQNNTNAAASNNAARNNRNAAVNNNNQANQANRSNNQTGQADSRSQANRTGQNENLRNVVSVSSNGDTVQVNSDSQNARTVGQDGTIKRLEDASRLQREQQSRQMTKDELNKREEAKRLNDPTANQRVIEEQRAMAEKRAQMRAEAQKAAEDKANQRADQRKQDEKITNFAGMTSADIERAYREGRISKSDYDTQIARRQEQQQSQTSDNTASSREMARLNGTLTRAQRDQASIRTAFSDASNANAPVDARSRMAAMQRIQDNNVNQRTQQQTLVNSEGNRQWAYQLQA